MSMLGIVLYCIDSIVCSVIVVVIFNIFVVVYCRRRRCRHCPRRQMG